jgi:type I restriction enzyme S subunit
VHSAPVAVPPLPEQQKVARILSAVDERIKAEEKRKVTLQALFKTMLHQLMTGKTRVKELESAGA